MLVLTIGCIVEGHGDGFGLPVLARRLASEVRNDLLLKFEVRRVPKSQVLRADGLENALAALSRQIGRAAPILVLLDADKDCPVAVASHLLRRCGVAHADLMVSVVIAKCEYEAWFLAAAESLCGDVGLRNGECSPPEPEAIRGAKEWLSARMSSGTRYSETRHQESFSRLLDLEQARRASSFRKLQREIAKIVNGCPPAESA